MGEIADMMLDGTMCAGCGEWLHGGEDGDGIPGYCASCAPDFDREPTQDRTEARTKKHAKPGKIKCPVCSKSVKEVGLLAHMWDKHAARAESEASS